MIVFSHVKAKKKGTGGISEGEAYLMVQTSYGGKRTYPAVLISYIIHHSCITKKKQCPATRKYSQSIRWLSEWKKGLSRMWNGITDVSDVQEICVHNRRTIWTPMSNTISAESMYAVIKAVACAILRSTSVL